MNKISLGLAIVVMYMIVGSAFVHALNRPIVYKSWVSDKHYVMKIELPDENGNTICLKNWRDPRFLKVLRDGHYEEVWVR